MAVTSIWAIQNRMETVISYVVNPEKTIERPELSPEAVAARKAVGEVIEYASNGNKNDQMMYVTGINCNPDYAADDFMNTKRMWGKTGGRLAYHGYQSFREGDGELTAKQAHEIGVKLAQELWGDRFEVVVATHLNTGHLHNHYVVNSVSLVDGYKYRRTIADYHHMREVSDRLCREAHLHVVEQQSVGRGKTYDEWLAERKNRPTVRGRIREDIDYAIKMSRSEKDFARTLQAMGYEFRFYRKDGSWLEHPGLKPPGAKSYFRFRSLGENYDFDQIQRRIIENTTARGSSFLIERTPYRKWAPPDASEDNGLPFTYKRYCIRLYSYISKPAQKEYIPMALREDIRKLDNYIEQMDFLYSNGVDSRSTLLDQRNELQEQLKELIKSRKRLYKDRDNASRMGYGSKVVEIKADISEISKDIRRVRKKLAICDDVVISSDRVTDCVDAPDRNVKSEPIKRNDMKDITRGGDGNGSRK